MDLPSLADTAEADAAAEAGDSFLRRVARSVANTPKQRIFARWYNGKGDVESIRTFHGVWAASGEIAHLLRVVWGLDKGDRVVLAFDFGLRFFVVFLGCLRAGVVAVPVYPPNPATLKKSLRKLRLIVESCEPKMVLVCPQVNKLRLAARFKAMATGSGGWPNLPFKCPDVREEVAASASSSFAKRRGGGSNFHGEGLRIFDEPNIMPEDVAFLQYTSGSTSDPKGVKLTFRNIEHNIECVVGSSEAEITARGGAQGQRVWFSWLPTFHDMGLIQGTLVPFVAGWTSAYCSPASFMRTPLIWLQLMSKEKTQMTAAPDFAYRLCVRKWNEMTPEAQAALNLDLRHVMFMQNAAEPIRVSTVREFAKTFKVVGLPPHAPNAAYGLAEHTVGLAATSPNREGISLDSIPDIRLQSSGEVSYSAKHGVDIKIVDHETFREVPTGCTGELWVASASVGAGYWGKLELSRETFEARITYNGDDGTPRLSGTRYLRTGDLCRVDAHGFLYVEGRLKDLVIVGGRNIYPQDIEFVAQDASSLVRPGCVAAFSETELGGSLEIVAEIRQGSKKDLGAVMEALEAVRRSVIDESGLFPSRVVAIKEKSIPKTTSGKIQRRKTRKMLHDGGLPVVRELAHPTAQAPSYASDRAALTPNYNFHEPGVPPYMQGAPSTQAVEEMSPSGLGPGTFRTPSLLEASPAEENKEPEEGRSIHSSPEQADFRRNNKRQTATLHIEEVVRTVEKVTGIDSLGASENLLDLGVDSAASIGIITELSEASGYDLPAELVYNYSTAALITEFVNSLRQSEDFKIEAGDQKMSSEATAGRSKGIPTANTRTDGWSCAGASRLRLGGEAWTVGPMRGWTFRLTQIFLLVVVLVQVIIAVQTALYCRTAIEDSMLTVFEGRSKQPWLYVELPVFWKEKTEFPPDQTLGYGLLGVLVPVVWFFTFSAMVILTKWVVVGVQLPGLIPLSSRTYLSWWFTNALLNVWEAIGGRWILNTRLLILFYRLMGAKVAWNASIGVFLRDLDLVNIDETATVDGQLYTRRFEASHMAAMPIVIGKGAVISSGSVVYGGTDVGQNCVIEPLAVIPPCSKLAVSLSTCSLIHIGVLRVPYNAKRIAPPHSVWEGHPAKATKTCPDESGVCACECESLTTGGEPCTCDAGALLLELAKLSAILGTLAAIISMTYVPTMLYASSGISGKFRYAFLIRLAFLVAGTTIQLALFTVLAKWVLAGRVTEGAYHPNGFQKLRRWYLGRLHALVNSYFLVFNRLPRYDWWSTALGMRVGCGSIVLCTGTYNPEDAHLVMVGSGSHVSHPTFSVDRPTGGRSVREKKIISIGSQAVVGYGSHLSGGSTVCKRSTLGGYSLLRPGECLPEGSASMSDLQRLYRPGGSKPTTPTESHVEGSTQSSAANVIDLTCTLAAWLLNALSIVGSFEVTELVASKSSYDDAFGSRVIVLWTVAVVVWAFNTSLLIFVFKWCLIGDLGPVPSGRKSTYSIHPQGSLPEMHDLERGPSTAQRERQTRLTPPQLMRWRWMQRVLSFSLFEPYFIDTLLRGTWLLNLWLRFMGADVSMAALILGKVSDHGLVKVCDGAVVAGVLYGHQVTLVDGKWSMKMSHSTVGERAVVHAHTTGWSANFGAGSTLTARSATSFGLILNAGEVYGGRPAMKLRGPFGPRAML